jgi:hypothetical protein
VYLREYCLDAKNPGVSHPLADWYKEYLEILAEDYGEEFMIEQVDKEAMVTREEALEGLKQYKNGRRPDLSRRTCMMWPRESVAHVNV